MKYYGVKPGSGKPVTQPLAPGAPDPGQPKTYQGTQGLAGAPDPFGQYAPQLQGNAPYGLSLSQELPNSPDPVAGNYNPGLPGSPDPYTGYQGNLPGAPPFAVFNPPEEQEPLDPYEPPEPEEHDIPGGPTLHNPGWFS